MRMKTKKTVAFTHNNIIIKLFVPPVKATIMEAAHVNSNFRKIKKPTFC